MAKSVPADSTAGKGCPFNTPRAACTWDEHFSVDPVVIGAATVLRSSAPQLAEAYLASIYTVWDADPQPAHSAQDQHTDQEARLPVVLHLSQHVSPPCYDLTLQQFPVGRALSDVAALLNAIPFRLVQDLPEGLHLHAATKAQLGALHLDPCPTWACGRVDFYTDGSFNGIDSAWSLVALGRKCDNIVSVSWVGDEVCVDAGSARWLGASSHGALQAETSAIIMFLWWSCSAGLPADVRLFSDCLCAIKRSEGAWHFGAEDKLATTLCKKLVSLIGSMSPMLKGIAGMLGMSLLTA